MFKRWVVWFSCLHRGYQKYFFFKSSALKYANKHKYEAPWVQVSKRNGSHSIDIRIPKKYPIEIYDEYGRPTGKTFGEYEY